jgi:hypothetical protein
MSFSKLTNIISKLSKKFPDIRPVPETTKPVTPVFTAGQYNKEDVAKLLGKISMKDTKPEKRQIKSVDIVSPSTLVKSPSKQKKEDSYKNFCVKQTLSLSPSVIAVREFNVPGVNHTFHISLDKSGRLWASDNEGNLVQTDLQGNQLQKIQTTGRQYGYHAVTQDEELIFTDSDDKVIRKITQGTTLTDFIITGNWIPFLKPGGGASFIRTGDWEPISIHFSHINGDILVGIVKVGEAKVTRYNKTGKELQNIQRDNKGQRLYRYPHYITENINGDICVSDNDIDAVVVVDKSGRHRFSYTGQGSQFRPYGICTDVFGHILVCVGISDTVHLIDQDGQFLSLLLTEQHGVSTPFSVCVDDENNLYVGQYDNNTVRVYNYLK